MITNSREADLTTKQEGNTADGKNSRASSSSSTPWSRLKDPRIVRVSRAFGGKDRHSKVCTVRGLRDRRVRLSVPTAIQLYDLQDRLGLNQPSKVVDWLLNVAKNEIDELPPLQMPPGNFCLNHQPLMASHGADDASQSNKEGLKISNSVDWEDPFGLARPNFWNCDASSSMRDKSKEVATTEIAADHERENWNQRNEEEKRGPNSFLSRSNQLSSIPGLLNNGVPYNSFYRWDLSNISSSNMGNHGFTAQPDHQDHHQSFNVVPLPSSSLGLPSGSQVLLCPPVAAQSYFPSHYSTSVEFDPKQVSHFQMLMSSSSQNPSANPLAPSLYSAEQSTKPLQLSMAPNLFPSLNRSGSQSNTNAEFAPNLN
ncbi:hypothetical protein U1Q18_012243 [Sarracenia purpurea var. burkii]